MTTKVRKQIYLEKRQNQQLKRLAEARGVSQAEVIRELIDAQAIHTARATVAPDPGAWDAILQFIQQRAETGIVGEPYQWNRDDAYEEREARLVRRLNGEELGPIYPSRVSKSK